MGFDVMSAWSRQEFRAGTAIQQPCGPSSWQVAGSSPLSPRTKRLRRTKITYDDLAEWSMQSDREGSLHSASSSEQAPSFCEAKAHWSPPTSPRTRPRDMSSPPHSPLRVQSVDSTQVPVSCTTAESKCLCDETSSSQALYSAACTGNLQHMKLLLARGVAIDEPIHLEHLYDSFKPAKPGSLTALAGAASNSQLAAVQLLLAHGASPNPTLKQSSSSPLHQACRADDLATVQCLLDHGANINAGNCWKTTPLMYAAKWGTAPLIRLLFSDSHQTPDLRAMSLIGTAAVHWAVWGTNEAVMEAILEAGADPNMHTEDGITALHYAAFTGLKDMASILVKAGGDLTARNAEWRTPKEAAAVAGRWDVVRVLEEAERELGRKLI